MKRFAGCILGASALLPAGGALAGSNPCGGNYTAAQQLQRAADYIEIQNVASSHEYYHSAWKHQAEIENSWSARDDVSWTNNTDRYANRKSFWRFYVDNLKSFPLHGTLAYHTLTTPYIVVSGDGKTAKGIYMSQGNVAGPGMGGGPAQSQWTEEKYGMDFIKENGRWKIWHLRTYVEYYLRNGGDLTNPADNQAAAETEAMLKGGTVAVGGPPPGAPPANGEGLKATVQSEAGASFSMAQPDEKKVFYRGYSTDRDPPYIPEIPKPYCRFSDVTPY